VRAGQATEPARRSKTERNTETKTESKSESDTQAAGAWTSRVKHLEVYADEPGG
jgi:hypothetical protein